MPLLIHEAQSLREPQALAAQYLRVESDIEEQIAEGMHFAVVCSEDAPRWAQENVTDEALAKTYMGTAFMSGMRAVCEHGRAVPWMRTSARRSTATCRRLILSGSNDPVTPQRYADQIMKGLRNGKHLVAARARATVNSRPAACRGSPRSSSPPVRSARSRRACVRNIRPTPFMLSRTAPAP